MMSSKSLQKKFSTVVFTYHESALSLLDYLKNHVHILLIVLPANRPLKSREPLASFCKKANIAHITVKNCHKESFLKKIMRLKPELLVSFNFPMIFEESLLKLFPKAVNIHPGDLPNYRGPQPLNWALINGESKVVLTAHFINLKLDAGNIISKFPINISKQDTITTLSKKAAEKVPTLMKDVLKKIINPKFKGRRIDLKDGSYYPKRKPSDGKIDWNKDFAEINNFVRALTFPWPGAFTYYKKRKIIVEKVIAVDNPGKMVFQARDSLVKIIPRENV